MNPCRNGIRLTNLGIGLGPHDTTTPVPLRLLVFLEITFLDSSHEFGKLGFVLTTDLS